MHKIIEISISRTGSFSYSSTVDAIAFLNPDFIFSSATARPSFHISCRLTPGTQASLLSKEVKSEKPAVLGVTW
jgi:hypothetical protein